MDEDIAETGDCPPVDAGLRHFGSFGQPLARFGQCLKVSHHGILNDFRLHEAGTVIARISFDAADAFEHVLDVNLVPFVEDHKSTACLRTFSRIFGCKDAGVTTSTLLPSRS